ncbi:Zn-dependent peptidase ImmA, M78 family [Blastococcus fimeti]|nr:Zn-dependent peptidase ImmA, M78 family [Blastococcus fimeti]
MNPQMLTLLRESRGLSQSALAEASGIPQPTLSKAEGGLTDLDDERIDRLATALHYPREVLSWTDPVYGFGNAAFHHRKQQSLTQSTLRKIHAAVNLTRMRVARLVRSVDVEARFSIPCIEVEEMGSPAEVARAVRAAWLMPMGPVKNMIRTLEHAGAIVVRLDLGSPRISAISTLTGDAPPVFILNHGQPSDRERWSLAHELGHLVMHTMPMSSAEAEKEADEFASEFLLPAAEIRSQLTGMDLKRAAQLKAAWRVSMAALIRTARDLGKIDEGKYKSLMVRMSQLGWRKSEPVEIDREEPSVVPTVLNVHREDHEYSAHELAELVGLFEDEYRILYDDHKPRHGLRVVHA